MNKGTNTNNAKDYSERAGQSSQKGSAMNNENYASQELNREHSDHIRAGEHNYQQDETEYGKIRQSEAGPGTTEQRAGHLRDKVDNGIHNAEKKVGEWSDQTKDKMNEWNDKVQDKVEDWTHTDSGAENKYEKAEKKMDQAHEKFAKGYENDGMRKMEKAEKKMDKAEDKISDAHEKLRHNTDSFSSSHVSDKDNGEDYQRRAGTNNPYDTDNFHS